MRQSNGAGRWRASILCLNDLYCIKIRLYCDYLRQKLSVNKISQAISLMSDPAVTASLHATHKQPGLETSLWRAGLKNAERDMLKRGEIMRNELC